MGFARKPRVHKVHPPSLVCSEDGCDVTLPCLRSVVQRHAVCGSWCGPAMPCSFASAALPHCSHIAHLLHEWKCWVFYQVIFSALKPFFNLKCLIKKKKKAAQGRERKKENIFVSLKSLCRHYGKCCLFCLLCSPNQSFALNSAQ